MIEAVIFDLDGVLVSTDDLHYRAWQNLAKALGIEDFTREDNERQRGVSRMDSLEVVLEKGSQVYTEAEKLVLANRKNDMYVDSLSDLDASALLPGAIKTLNYLKAEGIQIALGSASKNAPLIIEKVGILAYFDAVACGHDTTKSKPDPEVFLVAAKKLGIAPEKCLVVEDSVAGIQAAKSAGMAAIGVGPAASHPEVVVGGRHLADEAIDWPTYL